MGSDDDALPLNQESRRGSAFEERDAKVMGSDDDAPPLNQELTRTVDSLHIATERRGSTLTGRGSALMGNDDDAFPLNQELRQETSVEEAFLKKRGFKTASRTGKLVDVTLYQQKGIVLTPEKVREIGDIPTGCLKKEAVKTLLNVMVGSDGTNFKSFSTLGPGEQDTHFAPGSASADLSACWCILAVTKVFPESGQNLTAEQLANRIRGIGKAYAPYAQKFEEACIDLSMARQYDEKYLLEAFRIGSRVHRDRIIHEIKSIAEHDQKYDVLIATSQACLKQSFWRKLWLATFSPVPRVDQLNIQLKKLLKTAVSRELGTPS